VRRPPGRWRISPARKARPRRLAGRSCASWCLLPVQLSIRPWWTSRFIVDGIDQDTLDDRSIRFSERPEIPRSMCLAALGWTETWVEPAGEAHRRSQADPRPVGSPILASQSDGNIRQSRNAGFVGAIVLEGALASDSAAFTLTVRVSSRRHWRCGW
jgi:hypothetical protein